MHRFVGIAFFFVLTIGPSLAGNDTSFVKVPDVSYLGDDVKDEYAQAQCKLDVYYPRDKTNYATVVWFHGGGLTGGSRKSGEAFAKRFAAEGYGVVLAGYRLAPKVKNPVYTEDAAAAVAWTLKNIARYKGDPKKVFVSGHSAGGYLTGMVGLDKRWLAKHGLAPGNLAGLIPIAGQMVTHSTVRKEKGVTKPYVDEFAPMHHVRADAPPCLCIVGDMDSPDRIKESQDFTEAMRKAGAKNADVQVVQGRNHGSIAGKFAQKDDEVTALMLGFMKGVPSAR